MKYILSNIIQIGLFVTFAFAFPAASEAKVPLPVRIVEQLTHVYDLPNAAYGEKNVGYQYFCIKAFSVPLFTFDGRMVLYEGDTASELSESDIEALEKEFGNMSSRLPLWVRFGNSFFLLTYLMLFAFLVKRRLSE